MLPTEKKDIRFDSADGHSRVAGVMYENPAARPFCIVQLAHGMCEYMARYDDFARYLVQNGAAVCGNDHLGHGSTAAGEQQLGYVGPNGRRHVLKDLHTMTRLAHQRWPGVPLVLLGHSMGSFYARAYAAKWGDELAGLVLCGTAGPNPAVGFGIGMAGVAERLRGGQYRSGLVHRMAFGQYLRRIPGAKTPYDWISRDEEIVARYAADPLCTFQFTVNGFGEMFRLLREVSGADWANTVPSGLPVLLLAGDADPVGNYGKGVRQVARALKSSGQRQLALKLYPGARHELLNEINRQEVYEDILRFVRKVCEVNVN